MSQILLHVGFPKAGSTFLGNWFHRHPDIIFKDFTITGFRNTRELMNFSVENTAADNKIFVVRDMRFSSPEPADCINLDNIEVFQKRIAKTLSSLFPNAKVLIVSRGFESSIRAKYSQYVKEGGYIKFDKYFEKGRNSNWIPFNYSFIYELYTDLFGRENVLIIPFELLKINPNQFLFKIELFLKLKPYTYQPGIKNQSLSPQIMAFIRKLNKIIFIILFVFGPLQFLFYKLYKKIPDRQKTKSWNNAIFTMLSKKFKPIDFNCYTSDELKEKFSIHAKILKDHPDYQNFKKEYFIN